MKPVKENVAKRINSIRLNLDMSFGQLAERIGLSKSNINSYIRAIALPPEEVVNNLSQISGYSKDWIYYGNLNEYISDVLISFGYKKFVEDFPDSINTVLNYIQLSSDIEKEYPNEFIVKSIFENRVYSSIFEKYVKVIISEHLEKVELLPIFEGNRLYSTNRYFKNVKMTLQMANPKILYGEDERILEVAKCELDRWMELYNSFKEQNSANDYQVSDAEYISLTHLSNLLDTDDGTRLIIEKLIPSDQKREKYLHRLITIFQSIKDDIDKLADEISIDNS